MSRPLHIASASDAGYLPGLEVLVCSALLHTRRDIEVHFHIFDGGIPPEGWALLERHAARFHPRAFVHRLQFNAERFARFPHMHGNHLTYARLLLGEIFPALDRIVYLDSDIVVGRDVAELRDLDAGGRTLLAAGGNVLHTLADDCPWLTPEEGKAFRYFNAGVVVIDLVRWRHQNYFARCLEALDVPGVNCQFHDQTVMNYVLRHDVTFIDQHWNQVVFAGDQLPAAPANIHVIKKKPWHLQTARFDHFLWRAFYEDMIEPGRRWAPDSPVGRKLLSRIPRWSAARWLFRLAIGGAILFSRNEHRRRDYRFLRRQVLSDFNRLRQLRLGWQRRREELGIAANPPVSRPSRLVWADRLGRN
jgi:lipopolysaccharide biosynthesis glycosyltransferase